MKVAVVGLGLIGGSFEKASIKAGYEVAALHHGDTTGFSAGSYADMTRIATQDPSIWSSLFLSNRDSLRDVVDRLIARLSEFRLALADGDRAKIEKIISEGAEAKRR